MILLLPADTTVFPHKMKFHIPYFGAVQPDSNPPVSPFHFQIHFLYQMHLPLFPLQKMCPVPLLLRSRPREYQAAAVSCVSDSLLSHRGPLQIHLHLAEFLLLRIPFHLSPHPLTVLPFLRICLSMVLLFLPKHLSTVLLFLPRHPSMVLLFLPKHPSMVLLFLPRHPSMVLLSHRRIPLFHCSHLHRKNLLTHFPIVLHPWFLPMPLHLSLPGGETLHEK